MLLLVLLNLSVWVLRVIAAHLPQAVDQHPSSGDLALDRLRLFIDTRSVSRKVQKPLYTERMVYDNVFIPQYNTLLQEYEGSRFLSDYHIKFEKEALSYIKDAEDSGDQDTYVYLADLYMFGQSDIRANYTKALHHYRKAVESSPHGHAYFMLGFIYSTGMFGEVPKDKAKSNLYYQFASENGNLNASVVLANKYHHGIDRPPDCDMSKFYYSRVARIIKKHELDHTWQPDTSTAFHNIRLADFNGGLYGRKVSNQFLSFQSAADYNQVRRKNLEDNDYNHDPELRDLYFAALDAYTGTRFTPLNLSVAHDRAKKCMIHAKVKFGRNSGTYVSEEDRKMWSRCACLIGNLYLHGSNGERNIEKAYKYLKMGKTIYDSEYTTTQLGNLHALDPTTEGVLSENCTRHYYRAARVSNYEATYRLAQWISVSDPTSPFLIQNTDQTFQWWRELSSKNYYDAFFYYADAMETGVGASAGEDLHCSTIVGFYKRYVERSEKFFFPHLKYAFTEFTNGNFKNALLGYLIAAEQGFKNSQVTAAFLLYQPDTLFTMHPKSFDTERVESAMSFLELASLQEDVDSTIALGDMNYEGVKSANISRDYGKAFSYYSRAATAPSSHGCFKLGHMYEYGLGSTNATVDYHMAKRYYDLSLKYTLDSPFFAISRLNTYPMSLALLRLRLKLLFSRDKKDSDKAGWFSTFKTLGRAQDSVDGDDDDEDRAIQKSTAHFEGSDIEGEDDYEVFDYIVLLLTMVFFIFVFVQNVRGQLRRAPNGQNQRNQQPNAENQNFGFRRGNFEFHFLAL